MDRRSSQTVFDTGTVFKQAGSRLAQEAEGLDGGEAGGHRNE
jgi:hypothetical protein